MEAVVLSAVCLIFGMGLLLWKVNLLTAILGLVSWILYVLIYTPLKTRSPFNTTVGAVAGAIPVLMGWVATGASLNLTAWSLATVLFLWQFPHFMAIAWLYRQDYAIAGHKMLTVVDPTGARAGAQAVLGAALLVPVSLIPAVIPTGGSPLLYLTWTFALGAVQAALAIRFAIFRDTHSARLLLRASILFLPAWLAMLLVVTM
jgi:protoheme IX farnesyltransferase